MKSKPYYVRLSTRLEKMVAAESTEKRIKASDVINMAVAEYYNQTSAMERFAHLENLLIELSQQVAQSQIAIQNLITAGMK